MFERSVIAAIHLIRLLIEMRKVRWRILEKKGVNIAYIGTIKDI